MTQKSFSDIMKLHTTLWRKNMSHHKDFNTKTRKSKHLNFEERQIIEYELKNGLEAPEIAEKLGKHRTTIEREIRLGMVDLSYYGNKNEYSAVVAQEKRDFRSSGKGAGLKIDKNIEFANRIESLILSGYSPYAALQFMRNNKENYGVDICEKTLYNYLDKDIFQNITNKDLLQKTKRKGKYRKVRKAHTNTKGKSISERPKEVEKREEAWHWEIDLVVGKQGTKPVFLTLVERSKRLQLAIKLPNKKQESVIKALKRLRKIYKFRTITADNGPEFLDYESIEKWLECKVYYAHPYSSWERGSNEVGNKFLRRFFPKGMDLSRVTQKMLDEKIEYINNYPRKSLDGLSANMALKVA